MMNNLVLQFYEEKLKSAEYQFKKFEKLGNLYSFLRLFTLIAGCFVLYKTLQFESVLLTEFSFLILILAFAWLVSKQAGFDKRKKFYSDLLKVTQNEINSILRGENMYDDGEIWKDDNHIYTSDLDIFGRASLFYLLNRCATPSGNRELAAWLKAKSTSAEILERQEVIKEIASKRDWVLDCKALLLFAREEASDEVQKLFAYLKVPLASFHPWLKFYLKYVPWLFLATAFLSFFATYFIAITVFIGIVNILLVQSNALKVNKADLLLGKAGKTLYNYSQVFSLIDQEIFQSAMAQRLLNNLKDVDGLNFSYKIKQLSALLNRLEYRLNIFIGPLLNFSMAWDLRQLIAIEMWKQKNTRQIENAFYSMARFEALISLSSLHTNFPEWSFPEIAETQGYTFVAQKIGHPLILFSERVDNDFELNDTFKIDIITGSNMAGKSTFLRTLGINIVLALAGAPVCASSMKVSNIHVFTYMRIKDSLNEHTSTFKAELDRLRLLLEVLKQGEKVYFLIDEMLRGTNSVDKYLGSKAIIEKLISQKAVGIVATHDLQIASLADQYPDYVRNFYFDIQIQDDEMHFDYKLKQGECRTFNASALLRQLGIEIKR